MPLRQDYRRKDDEEKRGHLIDGVLSIDTMTTTTTKMTLCDLLCLYWLHKQIKAGERVETHSKCVYPPIL